jgi:diadenosine tetraphosphate (Ap4A) HIT family hydrolase
MSNATLEKFGDPGTRLCDYRYWRLLLRSAQPTLGSLVLGAKAEALAFSELDPEAYAELAQVTRDIERVLGEFVSYQRINYLMLMMVDPHVHFHVIPRYEGTREFEGVIFPDKGWPRPPDFGSAITLEEPLKLRLVETLRGYFAKPGVAAA